MSAGATSTGLLRRCIVAILLGIALLTPPTGLGQQSSTPQSKPRKTVGLLQQLIQPNSNPSASTSGPFESQVLLAGFANEHPQPDPKLLSKSLPRIRLTLKLQSGIHI